MDERRQRIHDDLRGIFNGELLFEAWQRAPFATDASLYEIDPLGVVVPRNEEDLVALVRYATDQGLSLHARGAGSGLAGESLGAGLVVDFSRHFRRIVEIGRDNVVVQPGVVLDVLNARLAPIGRRLAPDPSSPEIRTIGGMIGVDAAGIRSLKYGTMANHVESVRMVSASGEILNLGLHPWPVLDAEVETGLDDILQKISTILRFHAELIAKGVPSSPRNRAGYALHASASPEGINLARLFVGSEGTLGLMSESTLRTVEIPQAQCSVLLPFGRLVDAAAAVPFCLEDSPSACELHDWRSLALAREALPAYRGMIPDSAEAALVVEFEGDDLDSPTSCVRRLVGLAEKNRWLVGDPAEAYGRSDSARLIGLRRAVMPMLMRMRGSLRPVPIIEDVAVPPDSLSIFVARIQTIMKRHETSWVLYGHAGHGQLHPRPFLDLADPEDRAKLEPIATEVYEAAWAVGGTMSGEHGCGLARTQFMKAQFGSELVQVFAKTKDVFDPANIFNPGKVVHSENLSMMNDLRSLSIASPTTEPELEADSTVLIDVPLSALRWTERTMGAEAALCNGCGACRSQTPTLRMCPTFRALHTEQATPRAKANIVRQLITGAVDPKLWGTEDLKKNSDLCIHCNLCKDECPSGVDVSALMLEAKAAYVENHGLAPSDWWLSRVDLWARVASKVPIATNMFLASSPTRWLMERFFGLSRLRQISKAHRRSFLSRAERMGLAKPRPQAPGPRVLYFVDVYANHFDQELAESVVAMLNIAGVNVYVPRAQRGSGMPALVVGDLDHARSLAVQNLRVLGNAVRDGYTIVCSEPTAALMLRREYVRLTDDLDAELVAANTLDVGDYLAGLQARGGLPLPAQPIRARVGYHQPCHLRALGAGTPGMDLIRTIPELDVEFIDRGCSGMAGTYGLGTSHFRTSRRAGRGLLNRLRDEDIEIGSTECGACRMQMEQGIRKRTLHPIKLLAMAHGHNPLLRQHFKDPKPKHLVF